MQHKIFISYSRFDRVEVFKLRDELETAFGKDICWIDLTGIESHQQFIDVIIESINEAEVFLFMYSPNSEKSEWTRKEIDYAKNIGKNIIFVRNGNLPLRGYYLFEFGGHDIINLLDKDQKAKLFRDLSKLLGKNGQFWDAKRRTEASKLNQQSMKGIDKNFDLYKILDSKIEYVTYKILDPITEYVTRVLYKLSLPLCGALVLLFFSLSLLLVILFEGSDSLFLGSAIFLLMIEVPVLICYYYLAKKKTPSFYKVMLAAIVATILSMGLNVYKAHRLSNRFKNDDSSVAAETTAADQTDENESYHEIDSAVFTHVADSNYVEENASVDGDAPETTEYQKKKLKESITATQTIDGKSNTSVVTFDMDGFHNYIKFQIKDGASNADVNLCLHRRTLEGVIENIDGKSIGYCDARITTHQGAWLIEGICAITSNGNYIEKSLKLSGNASDELIGRLNQEANKRN